MRTALITGGNRGIGLAVAQALAAVGQRVILGCRSLQEGQVAARDLAAKGAEAQALRLDVADSASIEAALSELARDAIEIDVLVNNAGVYRNGSVFDVPLLAVRESMEVHFFGPLALCRSLVPGMVRRGFGRVVNVSSGYGAFSDGLPGDAAYALSKVALNALTLKLSRHTSGDVRINAACPGWVRTRMGGANADRSVDEGADTIVWLATLPPSGPTGGFFRNRKPIPW
jgi:NAD(P)-dependent dehydrogenase (short-subunit alcohol dehydrogenase family)